MFNPAIKVKDAPKEEKKQVTVTDRKEELNFSLFEQTNAPPTAAEKSTRSTFICFGLHFSSGCMVNSIFYIIMLCNF